MSTMNKLSKNWQRFIDDLEPGDWVTIDVGNGFTVRGAFSGYHRVKLGDHVKWYFSIFTEEADEPTNIVLKEECVRMSVDRDR